MTRLINADALMETMRENSEGNEGWYGDTWQFMRDIDNAPTIDAVQVVRCRDCKNWTEWENGAGSCQRSGSVMWLGTDATDFCSFAEREDNEQEMPIHKSR